MAAVARTYSDDVRLGPGGLPRRVTVVRRTLFDALDRIEKVLTAEGVASEQPALCGAIKQLIFSDLYSVAIGPGIELPRGWIWQGGLYHFLFPLELPSERRIGLAIRYQPMARRLLGDELQVVGAAVFEPKSSGRGPARG